MLDYEIMLIYNTGVKVTETENTEKYGGGRKGPWWVQGNALARGPGGRRPPEAPAIL